MSYDLPRLKHIDPEFVGVISLEQALKYGPLPIKQAIQRDIENGQYEKTAGRVWCVLCEQSYSTGGGKTAGRHKLKHCKEHKVLTPGNMEKLRAECTRIYGDWSWCSSRRDGDRSSRALGSHAKRQRSGAGASLPPAAEPCEADVEMEDCAGVTDPDPCQPPPPDQDPDQDPPAASSAAPGGVSVASVQRQYTLDSAAGLAGPLSEWEGRGPDAGRDTTGAAAPEGHHQSEETQPTLRDFLHLVPAASGGRGEGDDEDALDWPQDTGLSDELEAMAVTHVNEGLCSLEEALAAPQGLLQEGAVDMNQDEVPSDCDCGHSASSVELLEDAEVERDGGSQCDAGARVESGPPGAWVPQGVAAITAGAPGITFAPVAGAGESTGEQVDSFVKHLKDLLRLRGGSWCDDAAEEHAAVQDEGAGLPVLDNMQAQVEPEKLLEPVWQLGDERCPLLVLQELMVRDVQVVKLLTELRSRHRLSTAALSDILAMLRALLPPNVLPSSLYLLRTVLRGVMSRALGPFSQGFRRLDMCPNHACEYVFTEDTEECPRCRSSRHVTHERGKKVPAAVLRYLGLEEGVRVLLLSRNICKAVHEFRVDEMVDSNHSWYSSPLSDSICACFIPGYSEMQPEVKRGYKIRFLATGQVLTHEQHAAYCRAVSTGTCRRSVMLVVEGGCDAFQPFQRRQWSTWLYGYRVSCINWNTAHKGDFEVVTGIAPGKYEGKAAHITAALDSDSLKELSPMLARDRESRPGGMPPDGIVPPRLQTQMWTFDGGGERLEQVGVFVLCSGMQADAPMRSLLSRNLGVTAELGCDLCGIRSEKKGNNASKYLGYSTTCEADARNPSGRRIQTYPAWAGGHVPETKKHNSVLANPTRGGNFCMHFTTEQKEGRDRLVEADAERMRSNARSSAAEDSIASRKDAMYRSEGSRGLNEFSRNCVPYWDAKLHFPVAVYHCLYLGVAKDFMRWLVARLSPSKDADFQVSLPTYSVLQKVLQSRLIQIVLRNKPDCFLVDFMQHLGAMSMSEMQLLYEVAVPYLVHDLRSFGVPGEVTAMWLLLRHGMICYTRLEKGVGREAYRSRVRQGQQALLCFATMAQQLHTQKGGGNAYSQFSFTWKLHQSACHLADQILGSGHPIQASDAWVEQMMRSQASSSVKGKVTSSVENAIQLAHVDRHCDRACEAQLELARAKSPGRFDQGFGSSAPSLEQLRHFNSKRARREAPAPKRRRVKPTFDTQTPGDDTVFLGKKVTWKKGTQEAMIRNAVGFFFYTTCRANALQDWPEKLVFAASEDADYAAPLYPTCLEDATTQKIAAMWDFQLYHRCHLYGDSYVTSDGWRKQQKRDNSWLVFQHYTGPKRGDTRSCAGRAMFFVKATLKGLPAVARAATALGIPEGPHRFALVQAWEAAPDCQKGVVPADAGSKWGKAAANALRSAKVLQENTLNSLFSAVQAGASVFSVANEGAKVSLKHPKRNSGALEVLAVPVSSLFESYYHRERSRDNWAVHPMVAVVKERSAAVVKDLNPGMQSAIKRIRGVRWFFVHTYSCSNTKL